MINLPPIQVNVYDTEIPLGQNRIVHTGTIRTAANFLKVPNETVDAAYRRGHKVRKRYAIKIASEKKNENKK